MKKIWSLVLAVALIMTSFAAVPVSAAGVSVEDIAISTNVYDITCTVETETSGIMTALLTNKFGGEVAGQLHGIQSNRTPEAITDATGATTGYKYVFNFNMEESVSTGTFVIKIGFKGATTEKEFAYASLDDKIIFYDTLNSKSSEEISGYFAANPLLVPVELTLYNTLTGDVAEKVNSQIAGLNLATGVTEADDAEAKIAKLTPVDTLFTTRFAELMNVASIVTATTDNWNALINRLMGDGTFDSYYYNEANVETAFIVPSEIFENFKTEAEDMIEYTISEAAAAFDKATLTYINKSRSVGILEDAFIRFEEKGTITPDMTNIGALIAKDKDAQLWSELRISEPADAAELVANAEAIAQTMVNNGALNDTTGGVTGSGNGTGGSVIDKPTGNGGGGSLGGSSKPATKPEDTKVTFTDIDNVDWAKDAIVALAEKGVLNGKGDSKFAPNDSVTREEFVKIIVAAFELTDDKADCDFADIANDRWSYSFIAAASKLGIVSGDGTNFNPTAGISRQDMAVIIHRVFEYLKLEVSGDSISFDDGADIAPYAKNAVDALTAAGIINGMGDGTFAPAGTVTRAQAAKVVYGLLDLVGGGK